MGTIWLYEGYTRPIQGLYKVLGLKVPESCDVPTAPYKSVTPSFHYSQVLNTCWGLVGNKERHSL